jgi:hypothetical protein
MKPAAQRRCVHCGGNLYLEPNLIERHAELVCLQCMRRFPSTPPDRVSLADRPDRRGIAAAAATGEAGPAQ